MQDSAILGALREKLADGETKMAALHKPGSEILHRDGGRYRVHTDGSWRKIDESPTMSTLINNGGPAFPCETYGHRNGKETTIPTNGMSLRDWFAGRADVAIYEPLQTLKVKLSRQPTIGELAIYVASVRMAEADAMLAAREAK